MTGSGFRFRVGDAVHYYVYRGISSLRFLATERVTDETLDHWQNQLDTGATDVFEVTRGQGTVYRVRQ